MPDSCIICALLLHLTRAGALDCPSTCACSPGAGTFGRLTGDPDKTIQDPVRPSGSRNYIGMNDERRTVRRENQARLYDGVAGELSR